MLEATAAEITVQRVLAVFGAISMVVIPVIVGTAISRMQHLREIIVVLKHELNKRDGPGKW